MTSNKIIIGFIGEIASGKGTLAKYVRETHHGESFRHSSILRDILKRIYIPDSRENLQTLSFNLRNAFGQEILSETMKHQIDESSSSLITIDGIRRESDIANFRELPNFFLIAIDATPEVRYERLVKRAENPGDTEKTWEDFLEDGKAEAEIRIRDLMEKANFRVDNNGTHEESYAQIDEILKKIHI